MPREKSLYNIIPKLYRRRAEDQLMFGCVRGIRKMNPRMSIERSLYIFFKDFGIEDFNIESSMTTYMRMQKELYETAKKTK